MQQCTDCTIVDLTGLAWGHNMGLLCIQVCRRAGGSVQGVPYSCVLHPAVIQLWWKCRQSTSSLQASKGRGGWLCFIEASQAELQGYVDRVYSFFMRCGYVYGTHGGNKKGQLHACTPAGVSASMG